MLPVQLIGSNPAADPARLTTALDPQSLTVEAELDLAQRDGIEIRLAYTGELGNTVDTHTAGINLRLRF